MPLFKNEDGDYVFKPRTPGFESVAATGAVPIDLTGNGSSLGLDAGLEFGTGGAVTVAVYAGLMRYLELLPAHRAGEIQGGHRTLIREAAIAAWDETKDKAAYVLAISVVIAVLPGTAGFFALAGFLGLGVAGYRLVRQFYAALSDEQVDALKTAAARAGVTMKGLDEVNARNQQDESGDDPLPSLA